MSTAHPAAPGAPPPPPTRRPASPPLDRLLTLTRPVRGVMVYHPVTRFSRADSHVVFAATVELCPHAFSCDGVGTTALHARHAAALVMLRVLRNNGIAVITQGLTIEFRPPRLRTIQPPPGHHRPVNRPVHHPHQPNDTPRGIPPPRADTRSNHNDSRHRGTSPPRANARSNHDGPRYRGTSPPRTQGPSHPYAHDEATAPRRDYTSSAYLRQAPDPSHRRRHPSRDPRLPSRDASSATNIRRPSDNTFNDPPAGVPRHYDDRQPDCSLETRAHTRPSVHPREGLPERARAQGQVRSDSPARSQSLGERCGEDASASASASISAYHPLTHIPAHPSTAAGPLLRESSSQRTAAGLSSSAGSASSSAALSSQKRLVIPNRSEKDTAPRCDSPLRIAPSSSDASRSQPVRSSAPSNQPSSSASRPALPTRIPRIGRKSATKEEDTLRPIVVPHLRSVPASSATGPANWRKEQPRPEVTSSQAKRLPLPAPQAAAIASSSAMCVRNAGSSTRSASIVLPSSGRKHARDSRYSHGEPSASGKAHAARGTKREPKPVLIATKRLSSIVSILRNAQSPRVAKSSKSVSFSLPPTICDPAIRSSFTSRYRFQPTKTCPRIVAKVENSLATAEEKAPVSGMQGSFNTQAGPVGGMSRTPVRPRNCSEGSSSATERASFSKAAAPRRSIRDLVSSRRNENGQLQTLVINNVSGSKRGRDSPPSPRSTVPSTMIASPDTPPLSGGFDVTSPHKRFRQTRRTATVRLPMRLRLHILCDYTHGQTRASLFALLRAELFVELALHVFVDREGFKSSASAIVSVEQINKPRESGVVAQLAFKAGKVCEQVWVRRAEHHTENLPPALSPRMIVVHDDASLLVLHRRDVIDVIAPREGLVKYVDCLLEKAREAMLTNNN